MTDDGPRPPLAAEEPVEQGVHGHRRADPYAWLRDPNWREAMQDPAKLAEPIRADLQSENAHAEADRRPTAAFGELRGRIREDDASVPLPGGFTPGALGRKGDSRG